MIELKAFLTGAVLGVVFRLLNLPIPAPPVLAAILGIVGVYFGYLFVTFVRNKTQKHA